MARFCSISITIAAVLCINSRGVSSFAFTAKAPLQRRNFQPASIENVFLSKSVKSRMEITATTIPVEIKKSFVDNIVSKIREVTSGVVVTNKIAAFGAIIISALLIFIREILWKPSRTYDRDANSVGREYDAWTTEGILEEYWGEHIHLGYYSPEEMAAGYKKKNFIQAKYDFVDQMMDFGKARSLAQPMTVLDVGCGIGGKLLNSLFCRKILL